MMGGRREAKRGKERKLLVSAQNPELQPVPLALRIRPQNRRLWFLHRIREYGAPMHKDDALEATLSIPY